MNPINWPRFVELVRGQQCFVLTSHIRPDCDALGSELGMAGVLEALGKEVLIVNAQPAPPHLRFIDPEHKLRTLGIDATADQVARCGLLMVLDTSAWVQLGAMADVVRATPARKVVLDHHVSHDDNGAEVFKDVTAEATGRLVYEAAEHLGVRMTPQIATPLFAAIATDTGWFRFNSTTGDTYRVAGELVDAGARQDQIYSSLYEQDSLPRLHLLGRILARAETELGGRLIYTAALAEDFAATSALQSDTEDAINMTLEVAGTEVAVIFVELPTGSFKVSFRSRSAVDCSRVAEVFGGGGHKAAAGAQLPGPYAAARARVLDVVRAAMQ
jgi:phosphoesterase RecJ-like protein